MQSCEKCHEGFTWFEIYKVAWKRRNTEADITCRACGTEHSLSRESKILMAILFIPVIFIMFFVGSEFLNTSLFLNILLALLSYGTIAIVFPFVFKFHSKYHVNYKKNSNK